MDGESNSFHQKLYLLLVDKLLIGLVIGIVFMIYDGARLKEQRNFQQDQDTYRAKIEDDRLAIQLEFEKAKLVRELLPMVLDSNQDSVSRGYTLQSLMLTEAINHEAAIRIGNQLLKEGLPSEDLEKILSPTLVHGVTPLASIGHGIRERIGNAGREKSLIEDFISGQHLGVIREQDAWLRVLLAAIPTIEDSGSFDSAADVAVSIEGITNLLPITDRKILSRTQLYPESVNDALSKSTSRGLSVAGSLMLYLEEPDDKDRQSKVASALNLDLDDPHQLQLAEQLCWILRYEGAGEVGESLLKLATSRFSNTTSMQLRLLIIGSYHNSKTSLTPELEAILLEYLRSFLIELSQSEVIPFESIFAGYALAVLSSASQTQESQALLANFRELPPQHRLILELE